MAFLTRRPKGQQLQILNPGESATGRSLTAAGKKVDRGLASTYQRLVQPWQMRVFGYYDQLGEVKYASQFYSRMLSGIRLFPGIIMPDGSVEEDTDQAAHDALDRIQDPGGGRTGLLSAYGRLMFLVGEALLFVSVDPDTGLEQWEMLSQQELRLQGNTYLRQRAPAVGMEEYRATDAPDDEEGAWVPVAEKGDPTKFYGEAVAYRLWQRHPLFSDWADSTMQGILNICEELLLLEQALRSRLRSRLAGSGIMIIDGKVTVLGNTQSEPTPDEDPNEDPVLKAIITAMITPITDEGTASAVVPLILRADSDDKTKVADLIHHLQITDPTQLYPETGLRLECVRRMAIGLDMPPEVLEGMGDVNHWSAWSIDEQTWKNHGQPKAQQLCDDLTSAYYRPYLRDVGGVQDWANRVVGFDASAVINHPDRSKDAKDLHDRVALSDDALREAAGFSDQDAPSEEERATRIGILVRDASLAWYGIPSVKAGGIEPQPGEIVSGQAGGDTVSAPTGAATGSEVEPGPPPGGPEGESGGLPASAVQIGRLLGGADMGLLRAREAAGARIWNLLQRDPELREEMRNVRKGDICARLGRERVRQLGAPTERELVANARQLILDALRFYGATTGDQAEKVADAVEQHAVRTLYDMAPRPLPDTLADYLTGHRNGSG